MYCTINPSHNNPTLPSRPVSALLTPNSYLEALTDEYSDLWIQAMEKEYGGLENAGTFGATQQPNGLNVLSAKGVYGLKSNETGFATRAKTKLVARGCGQREGIDFFETFASTPTASCIRLLGAIACELGLDLCHFDAELAFVQSNLDEDAFMRLPRGCGETSGKVVRLNRSLYGLKHASRSLYNHFLSHMSLGFEQSLADACVLRLVESGTVSIVTVVHVDDISAVGRKARCDQFCEGLNRLVPINNLGELRWYASCRYSRDWDAGTLTILQQAFAENTALKFGVSSGRKNPLGKGLQLEEFDAAEPEGDWPFHELVGCLMWLTNQTRPDVANAVRAVARYTNSPREIHWKTWVGILEMSFSRVILALLFREAVDWSWLRMRMQTTPARPLIGGRFPVGQSCAQGHACAGLRGLKSA